MFNKHLLNIVYAWQELDQSLIRDSSLITRLCCFSVNLSSILNSSQSFTQIKTSHHLEAPVWIRNSDSQLAEHIVSTGQVTHRLPGLMESSEKIQLRRSKTTAYNWLELVSCKRISFRLAVLVVQRSLARHLRNPPNRSHQTQPHRAVIFRESFQVCIRSWSITKTTRRLTKQALWLCQKSADFGNKSQIGW